MLEKMGFFEAFDAMAQEGEARARELTANMDKVGKSFEKPVERAKTLTETVDAMATAYAGLTKSSVSLEEQNRKAALENIDNTVKQVEALALLQNMADNMSGDNVGGLTDKQLEDMERLGKLRQEIVDGASRLRHQLLRAAARAARRRATRRRLLPSWWLEWEPSMWLMPSWLRRLPCSRLRTTRLSSRWSSTGLEPSSTTSRSTMPRS
jgi:hypothetical protein